LLEELSLAEGEFRTLPQSKGARDHGYRLQRSHLPVPIENIAEDSPHQSRLVTFDPERFSKDAELLESVRKHGVLEPVYLEMLSAGLGEAGTYRPIAGHRRLAAARLAGLQTIDAILARAEDDLQAFALAENLGHRELTAYEKALSLMTLKGSDPRLSLRDLARRSGLPFGTVSSLVSAYEKSTPVLRRCFAEGLAPRAVQELQSSFENIPEDTQMELAALLTAASQTQAATFRQMAAGGIEPLAAAKSAMGFEEKTPGESTQLDQSAMEKVSKRTRIRTRKNGSSNSQKNKNLPGLPDPDDEDALSALSDRTGASKPIVRRLVMQAQRMKVDYTTLTLACAHAARSGEKNRSLEFATQAATNKSIVSIVRRHLDALERARNLIANEQEPEIAGFLQTIFFGA
jgi:ParB/RepB/Spo0J family partition protein